MSWPGVHRPAPTPLTSDSAQLSATGTVNILNPAGHHPCRRPRHQLNRSRSPTAAAVEYTAEAKLHLS
jgi:hypothetical protein